MQQNWSMESKSCIENFCLAHALEIRFDFLLRRHYMLCLSQCQSDSALTRTYWSSRSTSQSLCSSSRFLSFVRHFEFLCCTAVHWFPDSRLLFPVPRSTFFRFPFPVLRFPVLVTSLLKWVIKRSTEFSQMSSVTCLKIEYSFCRVGLFSGSFR